MVKPRRNGRPPIDPTGAGTRVSVRVSACTYDSLYAIARDAGVDVADVIRQALEERIMADRRRTPRVLTAETPASVSRNL